jgi:Skp family chaperone for outer membrane proteins
MLRTLMLTAALFLCAAGSALAGGPKLGVVDVQKTMESIPSWNKAVENLKKDFDKKRVELETKQTELQKKKDQLDAKRMVSDPKAIAAEEEKFMASANDFRLEFMKAQQEISEREVKLKEVMLGRIERVVNQVAQSGDFDYVFEIGADATRNVLYASKSIDLTAQVIEAYKKGFGDEPIVAANKEAGSVKKAPEKK